MLRWYFTNICGTLCEILELKSLRLLLSLSPFTNWKTYIELLFLIKQVQPLCFLFNFIIHIIDFQILSTLICLTLSWLALWKNKDTSVITSKTILEYIPLYLQIGDKKVYVFKTLCEFMRRSIHGDNPKKEEPSS